MSESRGDRGTLGERELHPAAFDALRFIRMISIEDMAVCREALASTAIEGDRLCEVCLETLRRADNGEPVSDRYVLGLAWTLRNIVETRENLWSQREKVEQSE